MASTLSSTRSLLLESPLLGSSSFKSSQIDKRCISLPHNHTPRYGKGLNFNQRTVRCALSDSARMNVEQFLKFFGFNLNDSRLSLVLAVSSQAAKQSEKAIQSISSEASKYLFPRMGESNDLQESLMTVPDLETIPSRLIQKRNGYEIREVDSYMIAETEMNGRSGFDFFGSSQAFNVLADYLFGKNKKKKGMEMTSPVITTRKKEGEGEAMDMTTPVISQRKDEDGKWTMSFLMPSKYGEDDLPLPLTSSVKIKKVNSMNVAVIVFPGIVTDDEAKRQEIKLLDLILTDNLVKVKPNATAMIAQYNPPFTPPFARRNEVMVEVEFISDSN